MIFNITYEKKEITHEINELVGVPFSFLARLRKGGIGSEKMMVVGASDLIEGLLQYEDQPNFCNMELRPRGVITYFKFRSEIYAWVIPYAKLSLFRSAESYRIYGDAEFMKVTRILNSNALKQFMDKLQDHRAVYLASIAGPNRY